MSAIHPEDLYEWVGDRVEGPMPLLAVTDGWIEASEAMARVHETIVQQGDLTPVVEFDTSQLLDQRARRPTMNLVDGLMQRLDWPSIEISLGTDAQDRPFLYLHGPEPDVAWRPFASATATIAQTVGVSGLFTIGAYPVPAPHTRPIRVSTTATCPDLLNGRVSTAGQLTVPVGVGMAIADELYASGIHTIGLFAQVPYYISTNPWPQASIDLLANLTEVSGLRFDTAALASQVADAVDAVESMLEDSPSLANMVSDLEQRFDDLMRIEEAELPSGDELEEELQQYLRNIDGD